MPQADHLGLRIPDDELAWNEAKQQYDIGPIDWAEFKAVLAGDGPCNAERAADFERKYQEGAWVREAASAYAAKHGD